MESEDLDLWDIIQKSLNIPMKKDDKSIVTGPKTQKQYNDKDVKPMKKNAKVKKVLICVVRPGEYNRISACTNVKKILDALQIAHEGINWVKQSNIDMLTRQYELFKMEMGKISNRCILGLQ